MSHKILETVIVSGQELNEDNKEFVRYFCETLKCSWSVDDSDLRNYYLKVHKTYDGFLVEYGEAKVVWGRIVQSAGFFEIDKSKTALVSHYFD